MNRVIAWSMQIKKNKSFDITSLLFYRAYMLSLSLDNNNKNAHNTHTHTHARAHTHTQHKKVIMMMKKKFIISCRRHIGFFSSFFFLSLSSSSSSLAPFVHIRTQVALWCRLAPNATWRPKSRSKRRHTWTSNHRCSGARL